MLKNGYSCFGTPAGPTKEVALKRGEAGGASGAAATAVQCKGRRNGQQTAATAVECKGRRNVLHEKTSLFSALNYFKIETKIKAINSFATAGTERQETELRHWRFRSTHL